MLPLRLGPADCFDTLRAFLRDSRYTEQAVCERLGLQAQYEILTRRTPPTALEIHDPVGLLVGLFLAGLLIEEKLLREHLPAKVLEAIAAVGLAESHAPGVWQAPVALYPIGQLHIVSDRWTHPDGSHFTPLADIVYPALTKNTYRFLGSLPSAPCGSLLELCSGTGIAALSAASGYARQAWAVDITGRATHFARFNRLLNGMDNLTVLEGDLYQPAGQLRFDRIVTHPPYIPATSTRWIFQDGGAAGEQVTQGIVAGLPRHIANGGRLYCLSLGSDRKGEPFENRARRWLEERESEFDVMLFVFNEHSPEQIASQPLLKGEIAHREYAERRSAFEAAEVEGFVYALLVVQHAGGVERPRFTARRRVGARTGSAEFEWALGWEAMAASPDAASLLLEARPALSKNLEMRVLHRVEEAALEPAEFHLQTDYPFSMESHVHPWTVALLEACDGNRTGSDLHAHCRESEWIPASVSAEDFARFLGSLISGGFLEIDGFRPPAARPV